MSFTPHVKDEVILVIIILFNVHSIKQNRDEEEERERERKGGENEKWVRK